MITSIDITNAISAFIANETTVKITETDTQFLLTDSRKGNHVFDKKIPYWELHRKIGYIYG